MKQKDYIFIAMVTTLALVGAMCFLMVTQANAYQAARPVVSQAWANHEANKHRTHYQTRGAWARILIAFGESVPGHNHLTPMTEADCRPRVKNWAGWKPFCDELKKIEAASTTVVVQPPPPAEEEQPQPLQDENQQPQQNQVSKFCEAKLSNASEKRLDYVTFEEGDNISIGLALEVECLVSGAAIVIEGFDELDLFAKNGGRAGSEDNGWNYTCEHADHPDECVLIATPAADWAAHGNGYASDVEVRFADIDNNIVNLNRNGTIKMRSSSAPPSASKYTIHNDSLHLNWTVENDDHNWFFMLGYYKPGGGVNIKMYRTTEMPIPGTPGYRGNARGYFKFKSQRIGPGWGSTQNEIEDHEWWGWDEHDQAINPVSEAGTQYHIAVLEDDYDCSLGWAKIRVWLEEDPPNMDKRWFKFYNDRSGSTGPGEGQSVFNNEARVCH